MQLLACIGQVPALHFGDLDANGVRIHRHLCRQHPSLGWFVPPFWANYTDLDGHTAPGRPGWTWAGRPPSCSAWLRAGTRSSRLPSWVTRGLGRRLRPRPPGRTECAATVTPAAEHLRGRMVPQVFIANSAPFANNNLPRSAAGRGHATRCWHGDVRRAPRKHSVDRLTAPCLSGRQSMPLGALGTARQRLHCLAWTAVTTAFHVLGVCGLTSNVSPPTAVPKFQMHIPAAWFVLASENILPK